MLGGTVDWSRTALGPVERWPQGLRVLVDMVLAHPQPTVMFWGRDFVQIYNERYGEIVGEGHAAGLGQPAPASRPELWQAHAPIVERVRAQGESVTCEDQRLPVSHHGVPDAAYFNLSYTPVRFDDGTIRGVLVTAVETTAKVTPEQQRAEVALRESEERFRTLADNIAQLAWMADEHGSIFWYNRRWLDYTGATPEEMRGWGWTKAHHPDHVRRVVEKIRHSFETGEVWEDTFPLRGKDGTYRWFLSRAVPIRDGNGRVVRWFGTNTDTTEQRQAAEELRRANERVGGILESITDGFIGIDRDWRLTYVNAAAERFLGQRRDELLGRDLRRIYSDAADFLRQYERAMSTGRGTVEFEARYEPLNAWFEVHVYPSADGLSIYFRDVTRRKTAEAALRRSEERFRQLADIMPQIVWVTRADGYHEYFNRQWYEFTGTPEGATHGEAWATLLHPEDRDRTRAAWRHSLATGEPYEIEYRFRHHSGAYRWTLGRALPIRDAGGAITHWFGTSTDIDALKRLQQERDALLASERAARAEAEAANRAKDRFLAVLSHELRTPLTPVALSATAMELDPALPYAFRDDVAMIRRNVELETRLIDDLLDVSRVIAGKLRLHRQPTRLHDVVRRALETVGPELRHKELTVETDCVARHDLVDADPARLQQVFWNLLKNAGKFTPRGGRVSVRTRDDADAGHVMVEVRDTGRGIPADVLPRVFDAFEQGADEVTRRHGGLGLGLAIAKAVMDLHGGRIGADSAGEGKGATFTVTLPLLNAPDAAAEPSRRRPEQPDAARANPLRLLLVEDHADTAKLLARLLRSDGFDVRWAHSVATALDLASAEPFDVVVSDLSLPDGSGLDVMRELRRRESPVVGIALSGYGTDEDVRASRDAGFAEHLTKPVSFDALTAAIRRAGAEAMRRP